MTDEEVIKILGTNSRSYGLKLKNITGELLEYLQNRYSDSQLLRETMYRIIHHIDVRPVCECCGAEVRFMDATKGYRRYCQVCGQLEGPKNMTKEQRDAAAKKRVATRYASGAYFSQEALEKYKQTSLERYGVDNATRSPIMNYNNGKHIVVSGSAAN